MILALVFILNISIKNLSLPSIEQNETSTVFPTETLIPTVFPTFTPGGPTSTPIVVEMLPTPQPGTANVMGEIGCQGYPLKATSIFLVRIEGNSYNLEYQTWTDENGRWFIPNRPPGAYTIMDRPPQDFGGLLLGTWVIAADRTTDFGWIELSPWGCEPQPYTSAPPAPVITPTITPGGPPTPTPINIEALPTPQPGVANVFGRVLCNGIPLKQQGIALVILEGDSRLGVAEVSSDVNGRWLVENAPPGTYTIMNKTPAEFGGILLGTWDVPADQTIDFGDVDFAPVGCEP